ncbi:LacI family transcriptional regulator [Amycolatopsis sp. K13G38]|uniref:LacI family transcriptional regulator n=2 Tax=Amycolatopsis acididurans TaxID=2724524 RepID=A0ABX1JAX7_9PSEU|nr:LacI family transcriptional regulator [Amycolatopsis acididurans]
MADVAAKVGVSRALVSLVFRNERGPSEETRARVFQAAEELGYRPDSAAQLLARSRSRVLGVLFTLRHLFHADLIEAIYPVAQELGYTVLLSATAPGRDDLSALEALLGHRAEGIILLGSSADPQLLAQAGTPGVVVGRRYRGLDAVHVAEASGARQVVDYLVELGHKEIVHIDGGAGAGAAERLRAYRAAMRRHGLADHIRVLPGDQTEDSGSAAARRLLAEGLPTAVFASNDRCAVGLMDALRRADVDVPGELSVAGFDDSPLAQLSHIDLTSVRQDPVRQAELAVRALVDRLDGDAGDPRDLIVQPKLMVRGTTGKPRT